MLDLLFRLLCPIYFDAAGDGGSGGGAGSDGGAGNGGAGNAGTGDPDPGDGGDPALGPAGEKALAEERRARSAADKELKATKAELEKFRAGAMSEQEKAVAAAKEAGKAEVLSKANERLVRAAVTTAATGKLTTPSLASKLIDLSEFDVDDNDNVDEKAIDKAISQLLKEHPELAAGTPKGGKLPGANGGTPNPSQSMNDWIRDQAGVTAS